MQESEVMARDKTIIMRIDDDTKRTLEEAAEARGLTLTTFVIEAATKAARNIGEQRSLTTADALLKRFRASCEEAKRGGGGVGRYGYERAGVHLARYAIRYSQPADIKGLKAAVRGGNINSALLEWFDGHYPEFMEEIPKRGRLRFVHGIRLAVAKEREVLNAR